MKPTTASVTAFAALAACGSSETSNELIAMNEGDTVQAALIAGETVNAKSALMNAVVLDRNTGEAMSIAPEGFALRLPSGADEDVTLVLNGEEVTFTSTDRQIEDGGVVYYGWSQEGNATRYSLWSWSGEAQEGISAAGDDFAYIWEVFRNEDNGGEYTAYTVVGTETALSTLTSLGTATYTGWSTIKAYPDGSYDGFDTVNRLQGDVTMQADFADGSISGSIDDLRWGWTGNPDDRVPVDGSVIMNPANIAGDGSYSGTLMGDAALQAAPEVSTSGGTYSGDFFGPAADETAGAISMDFSAEGTDYVGTGFFQTWKEDE